MGIFILAGTLYGDYLCKAIGWVLYWGHTFTTVCLFIDDF